MSRENRVLVVGPSWVGDMVMAQALFKRLHALLPDVAIDVVAPRWSLALLSRMPEVRNGIELDVAHGELGLQKRRRVGRALRAGRYDWAIVIPRSLKAAIVPYVARIPRRTGFRGEWRYGLINDMRELDRRKLDQTVKRFLALGIPENSDSGMVPEPALSIDDQNLARQADRLGLATDAPAVAMMPGAEYGPAKCWPLGNYAALARRLASAGIQVWILGSAKEARLGQEIVDGAEHGRGVHNLCGKTELADAVDLLSATRAAVTNDSGLLHVAAAVGTHVIALYGSSTPDFTPPLTASRTVFYERLECSPCFERNCPLGHLNCLNAIGVDAVESAALAQCASDVSGPPTLGPSPSIGDGIGG